MSVVPVLLEGYFITFPNYPLSATVGLALSVWAACLMAHIKDSGLSAWIIGLSVPVVFVIAGGHALTFALMLAFLKRKDGIMPLLSIAVGIVLMLICGRMYNLTFVHSLIWPVWPGYIIPYKALLLLMPWIISATFVLSLHYSKLMDSTWKPVVLSLLALSGTYISSVLSLDELERTVKIGTLAYQNKWEEVREMSSSDKPSIYNAYYWNVCNARKGRLADELLNGRWGRSSDVLFLSTKRGDPYFSMMYYTDALLEMGDVSQATDCALLAQTVMPGHYSSRMLRRLAEIAVVTADYGVASKYLDILLHTRNHKAWAADLLARIEARDIPETYRTTFQKSVAIVKPDTSVVLPTYLFYKLQNCVTEFVNRSNGSAQKNLLLGTMRDFQIELHEVFAEQEHLSSILATYDNLIENNQKQIKLLEEAAQRLYKEWFVDLRFPGYEDTPIVDGVPAGWKKDAINSQISLLSGFAFKSSDFDSAGKYKIVTIKNVKDGEFDPDNTNRIVSIPEKMPSHCILSDGDILLSLTGNVGRVCLTYGNDYLLNQRVAKLKSDFPGFTYCLFRSADMFEAMKNLANGAAQQNLSPVRTGETVVLYPTDELMQEFEITVFPMLQEIVSLNKGIQKAIEARDRLLPKLMSGEIEV